MASDWTPDGDGLGTPSVVIRFFPDHAPQLRASERDLLQTWLDTSGDPADARGLKALIGRFSPS